ncbi:MAG: hypothetical protein RBS40_06585 [Rhodocyclaceae bacterium]|nr:hypothetical protein [Rhodocyclaceae bacterium]
MTPAIHNKKDTDIMDLHDFDTTTLYFDEACPPRVDALIAQAAANYASGEAELPLLQAYFLAPEQLVVLVGLYRFYFYQHRLAEADQVAARSMAVSGERLGFPLDWRALGMAGLGSGIRHSMGLARFWLMSLKARAILALREGRIDTARAMLAKLRELDEQDRLGVQPLVELLERAAEAGELSSERLAEAA